MALETCRYLRFLLLAHIKYWSRTSISCFVLCCLGETGTILMYARPVLAYSLLFLSFKQQFYNKMDIKIIISLLLTQSEMSRLIATTGKVKQLSFTAHYLHALRSSLNLHPQTFYLSNQCQKNKCAESWTRNSTWGTMSWNTCHRICSAIWPSLLSLFSVETAWRQWTETCLPICLVKCTTDLLYYCQSHTGGRSV